MLILNHQRCNQLLSNQTAHSVHTNGAREAVRRLRCQIRCIFNLLHAGAAHFIVTLTNFSQAQFAGGSKQQLHIQLLLQLAHLLA